MSLNDVVAEAFPMRGDCFSLEFVAEEGLASKRGGLAMVLRAVLWTSDWQIEDVREQEVLLIAGAAIPSDARLSAYLKAIEHQIEREPRASLATLDPADWFDEYLLADESVVTVEQFAGALEPEAKARREMVRWLSHPREFGTPPRAIELWDRRRIHWPPTGDEHELFLYRFEYPEEGPFSPRDSLADLKSNPRRGVGLVGSVTFAMFGPNAPSPDGTPEDALALHCLFELNTEEKRSWDLAEGRKLLGFD